MELDTAYHYCSEIQVSVRIFQWKEKWVIFLLLTNWILSRWHGEKACWTHINNSRRLSNPCNPGVISRSRTHHPPAKCSLSSHTNTAGWGRASNWYHQILVRWRKWLIRIQNVSGVCEQCLQDSQQTVLCQSHYPRHSK